MPATENYVACLIISAETFQAFRSKPTYHAQTPRRIQTRRFCGTLHDPPAPSIDSSENAFPPSVKAERRHGHEFPYVYLKKPTGGTKDDPNIRSLNDL